MDWDRVIYNGTVVNDDGMQRADIYIRDGRVAAVTSERLPGTVGEATDASGRYILPGLIETHVHSRDGRLATGEKEDFRSSTAAAAATGITTVFEMPNCTPTIHSAESLRDLVSVIQPKAHADFCVWGLALGDANLASLPALAEAGCVAFKFFWGYAVDHRDNSLIYNYREGMDNVLPPPDDGQIYRLFRAVKATGKRLGIHAENFSIVRALTQEALAAGAQDYAALLRTRPVSCETSIIDTAIDMAKELSMPLHVLHVGVGDGVEHLRRAKADGVEFYYGMRPTRITDDGVYYKKVEMDEEGNITSTSEEQFFPCSSVIIAISQGAQNRIVSTTTGLEMSSHGLLATDEHGHTTREGIFASGDVVLGARTVVEAVKYSKQVAEEMDEYLTKRCEK